MSVNPIKPNYQEWEDALKYSALVYRKEIGLTGKSIYISRETGEEVKDLSSYFKAFQPIVKGGECPKK